ncbi:hypothetical protein BKA57DRAFT_539664, partial [Linnemannia elongata]
YTHTHTNSQSKNNNANSLPLTTTYNNTNKCAPPSLDKSTASEQAAPCPSTSSPTAAATPSARSTVPAPVARTLGSLLKSCPSLLLCLPLPTIPSASSTTLAPRPIPRPLSRKSPTTRPRLEVLSTKVIKGINVKERTPSFSSSRASSPLKTPLTSCDSCGFRFSFLVVTTHLYVLLKLSFDVQTSGSQPCIHPTS